MLFFQALTMSAGPSPHAHGWYARPADSMPKRMRRMGISAANEKRLNTVERMLNRNSNTTYLQWQMRGI